MRGLTDKQKLFCKFFVDDQNETTYQHVTNSAIAAGYAKDSAHVTGSKMLKDTKIIEYINFLKQTVEELFANKAKDMLGVLLDIAEDKKSPSASRVRAATDILDRAGHKATDKVKLEANVSHSGSIASTKEVHLIQQVVNTNEEVADALIKAIRERQKPVQAIDDATLENA